MIKVKSLVILLATLVLLSGCQSSVNTNNNQNQNIENIKQLENKILKLEEENQRLSSLYDEANKRLEAMSDEDKKPMSVSYIGYEEQYRFIKEPAPVLWMPEDDSPVVCGLGNTIVDVLIP